jgi:hypothetical protein
VALTASRADLEQRWLHLLQEVFASSAHELKGALNGVAINLEVVRSRSAQADQPASSVHSFAASAAEQMEAVIAMTEAMLALGRRPRPGTPVVTVLRQLLTLLNQGTQSTGGRLNLREEGAVDGGTGADPLAVRVVLAGALLAGRRAGASTSCLLTGADAMVLFIHRDGSAPDSLPDDIAAVARDAGIGVALDEERIVLTFPRA